MDKPKIEINQEKLNASIGDLFAPIDEDTESSDSFADQVVNEVEELEQLALDI